jgi:cell division protein FtsB
MNIIGIVVLVAAVVIVLLGFFVSICIEAIRDLQAEVNLLEDELTRISTKVHKLEDDLAKKNNILKG